MARSKRFPAYFHTSGDDSSFAKKEASRRIRRKVKQAIKTDLDDFDFVDAQDRNRGNAGSRMKDWGGAYYGDGRTHCLHNHSKRFWPSDESYKEWKARLTRK